MLIIIMFCGIKRNKMSNLHLKCVHDFNRKKLDKIQVTN